MLSAYFVAQEAWDACTCPQTAFLDSIVRLITLQVITVTVVSDQTPPGSEGSNMEKISELDHDHESDVSMREEERRIGGLRFEV